MQVPDVQYARSGDVSIAYQVVGDGPVDLVNIGPFVSSLHTDWEQPLIIRFFEGLAAFSRLIIFDKRGTGLSDRPRDFPTLETRMDDVRAVMDAAGSERAAVLGTGDGAHLAALFAASYPERTRALVLYNPLARMVAAPGYPFGQSADEAREFLDEVREGWGTREFADRMLPDEPWIDDDFRQFHLEASRVAVSPSAALAFFRAALETDIRDVLPAIRVPTLVLHRRSKRGPAVDVARRIPGADAVELPTEEGMLVNSDVPLEIKRFLAGSRDDPVPDRVLSTLLFTDIVDSTVRMSELGDRGWHAALEAHNRGIRREIARLRGVELDTAGDGFFASFDGPERAIRCGQAAIRAAHEAGLEIRAGLHTGECELFEGKLTGIAVVTGARVAALAKASELLVSSTVKDLVAGSGLAFDDRGEHELKGVPGTWRLYAVSG